MYYGNCSNAIFINYIPINILANMISGLTFPFIYMIAMKYPIHKRLPKFISNNFPGVLWPDLHSDFRRAFQIEYLVSSTISTLAIQITFGSISPMLTITIVIATISEYFSWQLIIWRYIKQCLEKSDLDGIKKIEQDCKNTWRTPKQSIWGMLMLCSLFYAFICFDMGFDDYLTDPYQTYIWTSVLAVLTPAFTFYSVHGTRNLNFHEMLSSIFMVQKSSEGIEFKDTEANGRTQNPLIVSHT